MLSQQDNEILCSVGPGTLMGNLLRRYWTPALLSAELPAPDCCPPGTPSSGPEARLTEPVRAWAGDLV